MTDSYNQPDINLAQANLANTPFPFTVSPPGRGGAFNSIQAAIDAAVAEGFNNANRANVVVTPGEYVEDVQLAPGIGVFGTSSATLRGTVTADYPAPAAVDDNPTVWRQVNISPPSGSPAILFTGVNLQTVAFIETLITPSDVDGIIVDNSGVIGPDSSGLFLINCNVQTDTPGILLVDQTAALVFAALSQFVSVDSSETAISSDGSGAGATFTSQVCRFIGRCLTDSSTFFVERTSFEATGASAIDMDGSLAILSGLCSINCDVSPVISGPAGTLLYDLISYTSFGGGTGIAGGIGQLTLPVENATHILP